MREDTRTGRAIHWARTGAGGAGSFVSVGPQEARHTFATAETESSREPATGHCPDRSTGFRRRRDGLLARQEHEQDADRQHPLRKA